MNQSPNFYSPKEQEEFKKVAVEFRTVLFFILIIIVLAAYWGDFHRPLKESFFCDCENIIQYKDRTHFITDDEYFGKGNQRNDSISFNGKYSVEVTKAQPYGLDFKYENLLGNETIKVTVWRKNGDSKKKNGVIVLAVDGAFWESGNKVIETGRDGWEKIEKIFDIPVKAKHKPLKMLVWNNGKTPIYFDDLRMEIKR